MPVEHRGLPLSRRRFVQGASVAGLGLAVGCGLLARTRASQQSSKVPRIGWLGATTSQSQGQYLESLQQGLGALGYVDGQSILIESRYPDEMRRPLSELAADLVAVPVDLIVATSTPAALAAKNATSIVPVVAVSVSDPVGNGLAATLARPGGNVTGLSLLSPELAGKRAELVLAVAGGSSLVAVVRNVENAATAITLRETEEAARTLGIAVHALDVRRPDDLAGAFKMALTIGASALIIIVDGFVLEHRVQIADLALWSGLPAIYTVRELVDVGGLMSYGANLPALYRRSATYVDKILKGAKPADLPIEQPTTFDFVINLQTAQALGLIIPQHVLRQATEVIQ